MNQLTINYDEKNIDLYQILGEIETTLLSHALELSKGNKALAARILNLNRTTFIEKVKKWLPEVYKESK